jgi:NADPH:quinone reductase-like Zn-dependent oxidoreductase
MKAAVLKAFGSPLVVETVPDPVLGTGEVVVDVVATRVLSYSRDVLSGERGYLLELPAVPGAGAVGRVHAIGPDATRLEVGDWVYCDPTVRSRDDAVNPDIALQGLTAGGEGGLRLQRYFRHGAWAERVRVPTENAIALGAIDAADAVSWLRLGALLVPYGGFLKAGLRAGETVVVNGATGTFGSSAVAVALAMGAGCVVATGRSTQALAALAARFGSRVRSVQMLGREADDTAVIRRAAPGPVDCVFDILPPMASAAQVRAAVMTVRPHGRVVLMGGVGMTGGSELELPYPWIMRNCVTIHGMWMYPREAGAALVKLVRSGQLRVDGYAVTRFDLEDVNAAIEHAAAHAGPFEATVIQP